MDLDFLYQLQLLRSPGVSVFMNGCSYLANEILVVLLLCILYWCLNKDLAYKLCFSYFASGLAVQGLKVAFRIPRPWIRDARLSVDAGAAADATGYSFPSGHTQTATSLYGTLAFHFKKWWSYLAGFVIIGLVMLSRMFLGCHTPQDVCVSFAISIILVIVVSNIYDRVTFTDKSRLVVFLLLEALSLAVMIFTWIMIGTGKIAANDYSNAYDAFKVAGAGIGFGFGYYLEKSLLNFDPKQNKKVWVQIIKVVIGLALALALKELPKSFITDATPVTAIIYIHIIRYTLTVFWLIYLYPMIFTKILNKKKAAQ